jgi:hypothetical protein
MLFHVSWQVTIVTTFQAFKSLCLVHVVVTELKHCVFRRYIQHLKLLVLIWMCSTHVLLAYGEMFYLSCSKKALCIKMF